MYAVLIAVVPKLTLAIVNVIHYEVKPRTHFGHATSTEAGKMASFCQFECSTHGLHAGWFLLNQPMSPVIRPVCTRLTTKQIPSNNMVKIEYEYKTELQAHVKETLMQL